MGGDAGVVSEPGEGSCFWFRIHAGLVAADEEGSHAGRQIRDTASQASAPLELSGRVLVVEDNLTNRKVIEAVLTNHGLSVSVAEDGLQGVNAIVRGAAPDLVLMDIQMPVLDGYAATRQIRLWEADNGRSRMPIIALTADAYEEDRQRCLAAGMDDFLTKPIDIKKLLGTLSKWLNREHDLADNSGVASESAAAPYGKEAIFDEHFMLDQIGGDRTLARTLIVTATEDMQDYLDQLEQGASTGDWKLAQRAAHTMKSLAAQFGGTRLSKMMIEADARLKRGEKIDARELAGLRIGYTMLKDAMRAWMKT
jgi:CheY-like chemotaxis protein/HPt (histidine-containing phosphotransfer) domain-containing protein